MKVNDMRLAVKEIQLILAQAEEHGSVIPTTIGPVFMIHEYKLTPQQMDLITATLKTLEAQLASSNPWDV